MQVIVVNPKDNKTLDSALAALKDLGYDVYKDDSLSVFNAQEAEFRIENISLSEEEKEIYDNLTKEEQEEIISEIAIQYDQSDILDYDFLDNIARDCFYEYINKKEKGEQ